MLPTSWREHLPHWDRHAGEIALKQELLLLPPSILRKMHLADSPSLREHHPVRLGMGMTVQDGHKISLGQGQGTLVHAFDLADLLEQLTGIGLQGLD